MGGKLGKVACFAGGGCLAWVLRWILDTPCGVFFFFVSFLFRAMEARVIVMARLCCIVDCY
jgi:hypothetical protein